MFALKLKLHLLDKYAKEADVLNHSLHGSAELL